MYSTGDVCVTSQKLEYAYSWVSVCLSFGRGLFHIMNFSALIKEGRRLNVQDVMYVDSFL